MTRVDEADDANSMGWQHAAGPSFGHYLSNRIFECGPGEARGTEPLDLRPRPPADACPKCLRKIRRQYGRHLHTWEDSHGLGSKANSSERTCVDCHIEQDD